MQTQAADKPEILCVLFIEPNGSTLSWSAAEIRAKPELFKSFCADEAARGIRPLAMRGYRAKQEA